MIRSTVVATCLASMLLPAAAFASANC